MGKITHMDTNINSFKFLSKLQNYLFENKELYFLIRHNFGEFHDKDLFEGIDSQDILISSEFNSAREYLEESKKNNSYNHVQDAFKLGGGLSIRTRYSLLNYIYLGYAIAKKDQKISRIPIFFCTSRNNEFDKYLKELNRTEMIQHVTFESFPLGIVNYDYEYNFNNYCSFNIRLIDDTYFK